MTNPWIRSTWRGLCALLAFAVLSAFATAQTELEWAASGSHPQEYEMGGDPAVAPGTDGCGFIHSITEETNGFGTWMTSIGAAPYRGKRVRLTASLRTADVEQGALLWLRVDDAKHNALAFDNTEDEPLTGTSDWKEFTLVLDVAEEADSIVFGSLLLKGGEMWTADLKLDAVGSDVAVTSSPPPPVSQSALFQRFLGVWEGNIVSTQEGVDENMVWPFRLEGRPMLGGEGVLLEGSFDVPDYKSHHWSLCLLPDSRHGGISMLEATSSGEVNLFRGSADESDPPAVTLEARDVIQGIVTTQDLNITFPDESAVEFNTVFRMGGRLVMTQHTVLKKQ